MLATRLEKYVSNTAGIPFVLHSALERNVSSCGSEANRHENLEIQFITNGGGYVLLDGKHINVTAGDIIVVNSQVIHYTATETSLQYDCLIIDTLFSCGAGINPQKYLFEDYFSSKILSDYIEELKKIYFDTTDICRTAKLQMLILKILIELRESHVLTENRLIRAELSERIWEVIIYIREHYAEKLTLDQIAKSVHISKYNLAREFKEYTGKTVFEYIKQVRCLNAAELIRAGMTIAETADACGFSNMSYFTRTFKSVTGQLPSQMKNIKE